MKIHFMSYNLYHLTNYILTCTITPTKIQFLIFISWILLIIQNYFVYFKYFFLNNVIET